MTSVPKSQPQDSLSTIRTASSYISPILCWLVIAAFVGLTVISQARRAQQTATATASSATASNVQLNIAGRAALGEIELLAKDTSPTGKANGDRLRKQLQANIAELAISPLDKLKTVVMTRELQGPQAAVQELDADAGLFATHPQLVTNAATLRALYTDGPQALTRNSREKLGAELDWFGELAMTQGQPADSPQRSAVLGNATHTLFVLGAFVATLLGALFIGFLLLILLIVLFALGKAQLKLRPAYKFDKPVFLETFALWCVMFVILLFSLGRWKIGHSLLLPELVVLAGTLLVALWPLCRGYTFTQLQQSLGWNRGAGVLTEIGCGAAGYLAGLPIIAIGFCFTLILIKIAHTTPDHPISQELTGPMSIAKFFSLFIVLSVAAPILEETVFRGALYFHMRRRWHAMVAATSVAIIFAAIHPQGWTVIPALASIAIVLALLREWRGSLLASITAHGINNGIVLLLALLVFRSPTSLFVQMPGVGALTATDNAPRQIHR